MGPEQIMIRTIDIVGFPTEGRSGFMFRLPQLYSLVALPTSFSPSPRDLTTVSHFL